MLIVCPACGLEKIFPDESIPADAEMATCPRCAHRFRFRAIELAPEPAETMPESVFEKTSEMPGPDTGIPFEQPDRYEAIQGFFLTIRQAMLESPSFFSRMPLRAGYFRPVVFYLLVNMSQLLVRLIEVKYFGAGDLLPGDLTYWGGGDIFSQIGWRMISFTMAVSPILFLLALALYSALTHFFLTAFKAANSGFQATVRVLAYGSAPSILAVIPSVGPAVSLIWTLAIIFVGLRYAHKTSFPRVGISLFALVIIALGVLSYLMNMAPPVTGSDI